MIMSQPATAQCTPTPGVHAPPFPIYTRFRRYDARHTTFRVGWWVGLLATVVFTVGFSAPAWTNEVGLWLDCTSRCYSTVGPFDPAWLDAVRAMECLALICFGVALFAELYQDVCQTPPPRESQLVEAMFACAGIFGIIGVAVYGAKNPPEDDDTAQSFERTLHWGYGLTVAGSGLAIICACLISYSRSAHRAQTDAAMLAAGFLFMPSPMFSMYPSPAGYGYPYPFPFPSTIAQGAQPTSQVPAFYVINQGALMPVHSETPAGKSGQFGCRL